MSKKQRAAVIGAERQGYAVKALFVLHCAVACPTVVVNNCRDTVRAGGSRQVIGDQGFVPSADRNIDGPAVVGTPVPVEDILPVLPVPVPVDPGIKAIYGGPKGRFTRIGCVVVILTGAEQAHQEVRGLHDVPAIVQRAKRNGGPCRAVYPMGKSAMVTGGLTGQETNDGRNACQGLLTGDESALGGDKHGHDTEAGPAGSNDISGRGAFAGHAGDRMTEIPEISKGLLLDERQQGAVRNPWKLIGGVDSRQELKIALRREVYLFLGLQKGSEPEPVFCQRLQG